MKSDNFFEKQFKKYGLLSQRQYPNEELCRFLSKYRSNIHNKKVNCLEIGVGSGANLQPMLDLGLNIDAIDISKTSIELLKKKYSMNNINFIHLDMLKINELNKQYDFIFDIFSSYALPTRDGISLVKKVYHSLKKNGKFFSFFPSKQSDTWKKSSERNRLDSNTLKRIDNYELAYFGNNYPFRFHTKTEYLKILNNQGFNITSCETLTRSYNSKYKSVFLIVEGEKK